MSLIKETKVEESEEAKISDTKSSNIEFDSEYTEEEKLIAQIEIKSQETGNKSIESSENFIWLYGIILLLLLFIIPLAKAIKKITKDDE